VGEENELNVKNLNLTALGRKFK